MKKKLKNERIVNSINILGELNNARLPIKVAYAITKNINKIDSELKAYNEEKAKLIDKYGEKDKEGKLKADEYGNVTLKKEHIEDWNKDIKELLSIENEIEIHMIQLDDLLNSNYDISPAELSAIEFMIND
ncbi:hypothetical protein [uncultured Clostridium sp.]|uniref:hypothetical protein n=1 Tax=uncultured Clostridium sp. TaxID=59620 RepID=UPI002731B00A|nr:hypothetical protein [uncultured Clostridium sp.]